MIQALSACASKHTAIVSVNRRLSTQAVGGHVMVAMTGTERQLPNPGFLQFWHKVLAQCSVSVGWRTAASLHEIIQILPLSCN